MIRTLALTAGLAVVPALAMAQSTQPPVNAPNNNRPTNSAPVTTSPSDATTAPTMAPGAKRDPAGGVSGAPGNPPAMKGGTMPAQPAPSGTPNPAGGGSSSTKP